MGWFRKDKPESGPDYSEIDSLEKAQALAAKGELVPLLLLPEAFGGDANPANVLYVPPFVAELKARTDQNVVLPLATEGKITRYRAEPEYTGDSFIPTAIRIVASDPGSFTQTIAIWGEAVAES